MLAHKHLFQRAVSLAKNGKPQEARRLLMMVLRAEPDNQNAWIWLAETCSSRTEKVSLLEAGLRQHPQMEQVTRYRIRLLNAAPPCADSTPPLPDKTTRKSQPIVPAQSEKAPGQTPGWLIPHTAAAALPFPPSAPLPRRAKLAAAPAEVPAARRPHRRAAAFPYFLSVGLILILLLSSGYGNLRLSQQSQQAASFKQENGILQAVNSQLTQEMNRSQANLQSLQGEQAALQLQHLDLQNRFNQLDLQNQELSAQNKQLQTTYQSLMDQYSALNQSNFALQGQYDALTKNFDELQAKAIVPPFISIRQREVLMAFYTTDQSIIHWSVTFDRLESEIQRGYETRQKLDQPAYLVRLPLKDGTVYHAVDFTRFIDVDSFQKVIPRLYEQSPNDEAFIREVWNIVAQLTVYSSDYDQETPRYPLETLLEGGGDCEDTAILFASMIKAAPVNWKVSLVYMNADHPTDPTDPNHVAVQVDTGAAALIVETTSKTEMTPFSSVEGWFLEVD